MTTSSGLSINLEDFKRRIGLGTRANRFELSGIIPGQSQVTAEASALSLPATEISPIPVPFRGRILKIPGDRKYPAWGITVFDTTKKDFGGSYMWTAFHNWSNSINNHITNGTFWSPYSTDGFVSNWTIKHYDLNGGTLLKEIVLHNCWPSSVGEIVLASGEMDTLVQFPCELQYEYFTYK